MPATPATPAARAQLRGALLQEHLLGWPAALDGVADPWLARERGWARGFAHAGLRGVAAETVPMTWRAVLAWIGMPLAPAGALRWGVEVRGDAADQVRVDPDAVLHLPAPETLRLASGIQLRPARRFIATHGGGRLQGGAGLMLFCWPEAVLVLNCRDVALAGFLHGPPGRRTAFTLAPGEHLHQVW